MQAPGRRGGAAVHHTEHRTEIAAGPDTVYAVLADVTRWPAVFGPTIHAEQLEHNDTEERIRLWATANGEIKSWISRREFLPQARTITFGQVKSQSPVAWMQGAWIVEPLPGGRSRVLLTHDYTPVDDVPDAREWIERAVDHNSRAELAALKDTVETDSAPGGADLLLDFEDTVLVDGSLSAVYTFLYEAQRWPDRLPHVAEVKLLEPQPGLQSLTMDTRTKDGSTHTTSSVRVCFSDERIVYKQLVLPPLLTLHLGCWTLARRDDGLVAATSRHTVRIAADRIPGVLGPGRTVQDAAAFVRSALSTNSTTTLRHAKAYAEGGRHA